LHHEAGGVRQTYFNLPAWQAGVAMGTKVVTVMPANPSVNGRPAVQALYTLFDGLDGRPLAVIDGTALTYRKTAGDSALGAKLLAREDARTLVVAGAGGLSPYLVEAHRAVRSSIERVLVWNRTPRKAAALAAAVGGEAVDDLERAVRQADIVSCCTASTEPLVKGAWLKPGAHLDLVGGFTPEMRECDDEAVVRARIFVDSRWFAIDHPGDLASPLSRGVIGREKIEADLFELAAGYRVARKSSDITLYKNGGGGHLDLFTALFLAKGLA
jgi:ornithine cyclodeaminase